MTIIYTRIDSERRFEYRLFHSELHKICTMLRMSFKLLIYT